MKTNSTKKLLLFGSQGQVGKFLSQHLSKYDVVIPDRAEADFCKPSKLEQVLSLHKSDLVVNAAAYTDVKKAELEKDKAYAVNAQSPAVIAKWCAENKIPFVTYSTDYVFSSPGSLPHSESDMTGAINVYGQSKLEGEKAVVNAGGQYFILRTSWVYSEYGTNFLKTMLSLAKEREELKVVSDQVGAPTYAKDLSQATVKIIDSILSGKSCKPGIYHACNSGETTWFDFAQAIFDYARQAGMQLSIKALKPITQADYNKEYKLSFLRPLNSRLSTSKIKNEFGIEFRDWKTAMKECVGALL